MIFIFLIYSLFYIKIVEKNINLWYTNLDYYININIYIKGGLHNACKFY